ncbi:hypothetical protein [Aeromonas piscicola]|uniref:hypothetical protein n=1 Tax=Aeromonas piscicola TaxID=600645 RepID=UPI0021F8961A|nr:hypothetical protein [Aeromonas piscicola]MCW0504765.1 hypothetical protein [Aeromonas piscicola]
MNNHKWDDREVFFLYNLCVVNKFNLEFLRCFDTTKKTLMCMNIELDNTISGIVENQGGLKVAFKNLLDSLLIDCSDGSLDAPGGVIRYMLTIYSRATIESKVMDLLHQEKRARLYTFASLTLARDDGTQRLGLFGGAFFKDAQHGLFNYELESRLSKADYAKYIERCADVGVCNKNTFLSHLENWEEVRRDFRMVRWVIRNEDQIELAWGHLIRAYLGGIDPGWIIYDGKSAKKIKEQYADALVVFYDLLANKITKDALMKAISNVCAKKRYREKNKKITLLHYPLCRQAEEMLEILAKVDNKEQFQVIEDLIYNECRERGFKFRYLN